MEAGLADLADVAGGRGGRPALAGRTVAGRTVAVARVGRAALAARRAGGDRGGDIGDFRLRRAVRRAASAASSRLDISKNCLRVSDLPSSRVSHVASLAFASIAR